jgi:hypothetical protein
MAKVVVSGILFLFTVFNGIGQPDAILSRIILIGDAGVLTNGKIPVVEKVKTLFNVNDGHTTVLYLGDNVYEYGLPDITASDYEEKKNVLDAQVSLVKGTNAKAFFVPGNHDWNKGKAGGWQQLLNQQQYLESLQMPNVAMMPGNGCPGPVE